MLLVEAADASRPPGAVGALAHDAPLPEVTKETMLCAGNVYAKEPFEMLTGLCCIKPPADVV
jgi:hypothetical protein